MNRRNACVLCNSYPFEGAFMNDLIPSPAAVLVEASGVPNLLAQIRPAWKAKDLFNRVKKLLPVDPSSACQRLPHSIESLHSLIMHLRQHRHRTVHIVIDLHLHLAGMESMQPAGVLHQHPLP